MQCQHAHYYASLGEKFFSFGLDDRASALTTLVSKINTLATPDTQDILRFLLDLSDSPIHATWNDPGLIQPQSVGKKPELTWQDISQGMTAEGNPCSPGMTWHIDLDEPDEEYDEGGCIEADCTSPAYAREVEKTLPLVSHRMSSAANDLFNGHVHLDEDWRCHR